MLPSMEFICLRIVMARSSGRNCAYLAAPGGCRNQYEFICRPSCFIISVFCHLCPIFAAFEKILFYYLALRHRGKLSFIFG